MGYGYTLVSNVIQLNRKRWCELPAYASNINIYDKDCLNFTAHKSGQQGIQVLGIKFGFIINQAIDFNRKLWRVFSSSRVLIRRMPIQCPSIVCKIYHVTCSKRKQFDFCFKFSMLQDVNDLLFCFQGKIKNQLADIMCQILLFGSASNNHVFFLIFFQKQKNEDLTNWL